MSIQLNSKFCESFNIRYPIVLAGMAGIANMAPLVAAVSNAGGLGTLGAAYMSPEELRNAIHEIKKRTQAPFAVNIFAHVGPDHSLASCWTKKFRLLVQRLDYFPSIICRRQNR
ncbi:Nitronate monooxygenase [Paenibacillus sp. OK003]|nr:Nitronate monooxygenase [Paenibacillus sp. OK003]